MVVVAKVVLPMGLMVLLLLLVLMVMLVLVLLVLLVMVVVVGVERGKRLALVTCMDIRRRARMNNMHARGRT